MHRDLPELLSPCYGNLPVFFRRREPQPGRVAPTVAQGRLYPALLQALQRGIDRHALRNSSEIELYARGKGHLPTYRVYLNTTPPSSRFAGDDGIESNNWKRIERTIISELH